MGRLLSPAGQESDNKVYKHVIGNNFEILDHSTRLSAVCLCNSINLLFFIAEETENKSIEQILNEAKELISDTTPVPENVSVCFSTDDISSESSENDIIEDTNDDTDKGIGNKTKLPSQLERKRPPVAKQLKNGAYTCFILISFF